MGGTIPKLFFIHFNETAFIAEEEGSITGFLTGFLSQSVKNEAYIHFAGVHPDYRSRGVAKALYEHFFGVVRGFGCDTVRCVTSPVNESSIRFHMHMGFEVEPGDSELVDISYFKDYDGPNEDRVLFVKKLETSA